MTGSGFERHLRSRQCCEIGQTGDRPVKTRLGSVSTATALIAWTARADGWAYAVNSLPVLSLLSPFQFDEPPRM